MKPILTKEYLSELKIIAHRYHFPLEDIETVANIQKWCKKWRVDEPNPFRTGTCLRQTEIGRFRILLAEEITPDMQEAVVDALINRGFAEEVESLDDPFHFIVHLLLREIAHVKNQTWL
jgi:hypothetical protein